MGRKLARHKSGSIIVREHIGTDTRRSKKYPLTASKAKRERMTHSQGGQVDRMVVAMKQHGGRVAGGESGAGHGGAGEGAGRHGGGGEGHAHVHKHG